MLNRRRILQATAATLGSVLVAPALAQARLRVVVVGAGPAGATAALAVNAALGERAAVVLIAGDTRVSPPLLANAIVTRGPPADPSEVLAGSGDAMRLARPGLEVVPSWAVAVDRAMKRVHVTRGADRGTIGYDHLILAPGLGFAFDKVPGLDAASSDRLMPHGWTVAQAHRLWDLGAKLRQDGGHYCLVVPPLPYSCHPAPYERASLLPLLHGGRAPSGLRITIIDAKESFPMQQLFAAHWETKLGNSIEWQGPGIHGGLVGVEPKVNRVITGLDTIEADVVNVIPPQRAADIVVAAGLVDGTGYAPVDPDTLVTRADPAVSVIGDAAALSPLPKSASAAIAQGQVAAAAVAALATGAPLPRGAVYRSRCVSLLSREEGLASGGSYAAEAGRIVPRDSFVSSPDDPPALRLAQAREGRDHAFDLVRDVYR